MAKKPSTEMPLSSRSTPAERDAANRTHHEEMAGHLLDNSIRAGHGGHYLGKAGPGSTGHDLPPSDAHLQVGQYIPKGAFAKVPQSTSSDGSGSSDFNDPSTGDYGTVDK